MADSGKKVNEKVNETIAGSEGSGLPAGRDRSAGADLSGRVEDTAGTNASAPAGLSAEKSPARSSGRTGNSPFGPSHAGSHPAERAGPARWKVREVRASPFGKCGRLFLQKDLLVVRTEGDAGGFCIRIFDLCAVLEGEARPLRSLSGEKQAGSAKRSASGRAVTFRTERGFFLVPVVRLGDVLSGRARKAAVFAAKDACSPGKGKAED